MLRTFTSKSWLKKQKGKIIHIKAPYSSREDILHHPGEKNTHFIISQRIAGWEDLPTNQLTTKRIDISSKPQTRPHETWKKNERFSLAPLGTLEAFWYILSTIIQ